MQPNANTVQAEMEKALSLILRESIAVTGCGRTDAGVHASQFFLHFDFDGEPVPNLVYKLNRVLPEDIAVKQQIQISDDAHTRFDAVKRTYQFHLHFGKDPFKTENSWQIHNRDIDFGKMQQAADAICNYQEFKPFCKSNSDVKTYECEMYEAKWMLSESKTAAIFQVSANRFLRGMVRMMVGIMVQVGSGKKSLSEVDECLKTQTHFQKIELAPAHGLFLTNVEYPTSLFKNDQG